VILINDEDVGSNRSRSDHAPHPEHQMNKGPVSNFNSDDELAWGNGVPRGEEL